MAMLTCPKCKDDYRGSTLLWSEAEDRIRKEGTEFIKTQLKAALRIFDEWQNSLQNDPEHLLKPCFDDMKFRISKLEDRVKSLKNAVVVLIDGKSDEDPVLNKMKDLASKAFVTIQQLRFCNQNAENSFQSNLACTQSVLPIIGSISFFVLSAYGIAHLVGANFITDTHAVQQVAQAAIAVFGGSLLLGALFSSDTCRRPSKLTKTAEHWFKKPAENILLELGKA